MMSAPALEDTRFPSLHEGLTIPRIVAIENVPMDRCALTHMQHTPLRNRKLRLDHERRAGYHSLHHTVTREIDQRHWSRKHSPWSNAFTATPPDLPEGS